MPPVAQWHYTDIIGWVCDLCSNSSKLDQSLKEAVEGTYVGSKGAIIRGSEITHVVDVCGKVLLEIKHASSRNQNVFRRGSEWLMFDGVRSLMLSIYEEKYSFKVCTSL